MSGRQTSTVTGTDLKSAFLDEAKKQFDLDQCSSITNVQGLWLLFLIASASGQNRAASAYRFAAIAKLKELSLTERHGNLSKNVSREAREQSVIAKLHWGIFISDGYVMLTCRRISPNDASVLWLKL